MDKVAIRPLKNPIHGTPVGERMEVSRREARILVAIRRAEYAEDEPVQPVAESKVEPKLKPMKAKVETAAKDEVERKGTYKRRDLTAESE